MTDTYKVLGQTLTGYAIDGTTLSEQILYTVPNGKQAAISSINITNGDSSSKTYTLAFVPSADISSTYSTANYYPNGTPKFIVLNTINTASGLYSENGITWSDITMPFAGYWTSVAYGNNTYVAIAAGTASAASSSNGITWTTRTLPASRSWSTVKYANGKFVAIASNSNKAAYSTDGITWVETTLPLTSQWSGLAYGNNKWVVGSDQSASAAYSTDGINWVATTSPKSLPSIAFGNGIFVSGNNGQITSTYATSTDGITWTSRSISSGGWGPVTYLNDRFVMTLSGSTRLAYSTNGIAFTETSLPTPSSWGNASYGNGKYIIQSTTSDNTISTSTDFINWKNSTIGSSQFVTWNQTLMRSEVTTIPQTILTSLSKHKAVINKKIAVNETHEFKGGITLQAGDQIRLYSSSSSVIGNVYGAEIS